MPLRDISQCVLSTDVEPNSPFMTTMPPFLIAQISDDGRKKMIRDEARISNFREGRSSNLYDFVEVPVME